MIYIIDMCVFVCRWVGGCGGVDGCLCVPARVSDGYSLQSNILYSNINFILVSKYFQIIKTIKITFFSMDIP